MAHDQQKPRSKQRPISYRLCNKHNSSLNIGSHKHSPRPYMREYMRQRRPAAKSPKYFLGLTGECAVRELLVSAGRSVLDQPNKCRWDFIVDGWQIEVMTVNPSRPTYWTVNIQRNGKLNEQADFYILRLLSNGDPLHLLLKAPVGKKGIGIPFALTPFYQQCAWAFSSFLRGEYGIKPSYSQTEIPQAPASVPPQLFSAPVQGALGGAL